MVSLPQTLVEKFSFSILYKNISSSTKSSLSENFNYYIIKQNKKGVPLKNVHTLLS